MLLGLHFEESIKTVIYHVYNSGVVCNTPNLINNHFRSTPYYLKGDVLKTVHARFYEWPIVPLYEVPYPALNT